ncbi:cytokine-dependent hematopoietic cell linker isoform X3 [Xiphophorus maculatus]|uniref:cytokine-dependent hematopoietic cell linker isoform X3 n=1 Tax=Xiphophorus maculatus TaxID=8083 RepID=UPI000C6CC813|nr:cytokine-dependent hematopoietic cell linker isoform X3 [Xiphophorus maculatus]
MRPEFIFQTTERRSSYEFAVIMDRFREDRNRAQTCGDIDGKMEPEYDVVDDHEEVHNVRIFPARPINDEREYADRDIQWPSSAQSLSSISTRRPLPRCPPRETPQYKVPVVNRDIKPGRQKVKIDRRPLPLEPEEQHSRRSSSPHPPSALDVSNNLAGLAVHETYRRDRQMRNTEKADFRSHARSPQSTKDGSGILSHQRHSLDLETHDLENRSHQHVEGMESRRHHHEWPQTKEDIDQNDFVPMDKPNTYCEEDWYIGHCNRTDAEHALHLVNKDGAYLVRDCSNNTNSEPLVLVVYHEKKVYNVKIRFIGSLRKYALGTGQRSNDMFDSVAGIIKFHSIFPITLVSGRNTASSKCPENCVLTCPITKSDVVQLLQ